MGRIYEPLGTDRQGGLHCASALNGKWQCVVVFRDLMQQASGSLTGSALHRVIHEARRETMS